ncbi:unnamed protein product [Linum trigynum]|uniref:Uncharacterized protein n=1 Tax=Linum trigynum TaxID=586398 RepID=A0AAV2C811_9ROSI
MPSFPQPGSVTICEINRQLIAAESLSDERARETYGKLLGAVFSPVPFQADQLAASPNVDQEAEQDGRGNGESVGRKILGKAFQGFVNMFHPNYVNLLPEVGLHGVSWHQHKHIIAFVSGQNQVTICDYEDSVSTEGKDCILISESQRDVKVLEWRSNCGKSLAIACKGGICIWSASYPGNAAVGRSGVTSYLATVSGGSGYQWALVDFLGSCNDEKITALSWSPDGRYPLYVKPSFIGSLLSLC